MQSRLFSGKAIYAVASLLVLLVIVLALFQHKWFGELSERESERMKSNLRNGAFQFSMEVERELSRFQLLADAGRVASSEERGVVLRQQLELWHAATAYPALVEEIYVVNDRARGAWILQGNQLVAIGYPPADWRAPLAVPESWRRIGFGPGPAVFLKSDLRQCCILDDASRGEEPEDDQIIVSLDREFLLDSVFARLLETYFGKNESSGLDIAIVQKQGETTEVVFASSATARTIAAERADVVVPFPGGRPPGGFGARPGSQPPPEVMMRDRQFPERPFGRESMLEIRIRHRAGSLEAAVQQNRLINLAIGSGILLLLLAGVGFIVMTSKRAERLARQQIEFVAGISHELRTPLAVLHSVGDNLADGVVTEIPKARAYGRMVRTEVQRLSTMVENALAYAGITSGKSAPDLHPVDLREVVRKACQSSQFLLEEQGVDLEVDLPESLPQVPGDAPALQSVVENLLSNAMKYSDEHPWIGIQVVHDAGQNEVVVAVRDRGMGIARREIPHLFEPFYRGKEAVERQIRGSGLGLNLVHHIVKRHGGSLTVESTVGKGSSFIVRLPVNGTAKA